MSTATLSSTAAPGLLTSTNLFLFLLAPALALFYVYWKVSRKHMVELAERIPGPTGYPILGNALEFIGSPNRKIFSYFCKTYVCMRTNLDKPSTTYFFAKSWHSYFCTYRSDYIRTMRLKLVCLKCDGTITKFAPSKEG